MKPSPKACSCWSIALCMGVLCCAAPYASAAPCEPWAGRVVSLQGQVQLLRGNSLAQPVSLQQTLCPGDRLSVGQHSRAEVQLPNETVLRLDADTVFNLIAPSTGKRSWVELVRGVVHFLSRVHGSLDIKTPFINATIDGTELVLKVDDRETQLWVLEGKVRFANEFGSLQVNTGQAAAAEKGKAPVYRLLIKPRDAVQWALYYPPIVDYRPGVYAGSPGSRYLDQAMADYRRGDLPSALNQLERAPPEYRDSRYFAVHAGLLLSAGRVDEANNDIQQELRLRPNEATPHALRAIIALTQNRKDEALTEARRATELEPNAPIGHIALSYAQQAAFNLDKATESTQRAIRLSPDNALAHARLAELELSRGYRSQGIAAARKAAQLEPRLARTHTVLGFAYLTEIKINEAKLAFERAIHLDSTDPLARLGLGVAKIRKGKLKEGTEELELATSLDPNNSLIRSYLGKAYYEQRRPKIAETEFKNAKELDPKDPTPYFYDAIHKQTTNRPVEALRDLQRAMDLNSNRAVYRSSLLLDKDEAARSANLARTYENIAFSNRARLEAWKSVALEPSNYSSHRFLADSYAALPRHDIARASELLQSQLLQPTNITPIPPQLAETDLAILESAGPTINSYNEFSPLFVRNGIALQANGVFGSQGTIGDDVVGSIIRGPFSASIGQFHYETDGFGKNRDFTHNVYNAFGQFSINPGLGIQAEFRRRDTESGDVASSFLRENDLEDRNRLEQYTARLGANYEITPSQRMLFSFVYQDTESTTKNIIPFAPFPEFGFPNPTEVRTTATNRTHAYQFELQHIFRKTNFQTIAGIGYLSNDFSLFDKRETVDLAFNSVAIVDGERISRVRVDDNEHTNNINAYLYVPITLGRNALLTLGASYDSIEEFGIRRNRVHPKFGLVWNVTPTTTLRAAAFSASKRPFAANQTIEPTLLAGFNQFFDDTNGTDSQRYGVGIDQKILDKAYVGGELSWRDVDYIKVQEPEERTFTLRDFRVFKQNQKEVFHRAYFYWMPTNWVAFRAEYRYEEFDRKNLGRELSGPDKLQTHMVPIGVSVFHPSGIFGSIQGTYVDQFIKFDEFNGRPDGHDGFWVADASVGYRLPKRYGIVSFTVKNIFNEQISFQDTFNVQESRPSQFSEERAFLGRLNFWLY